MIGRFIGLALASLVALGSTVTSPSAQGYEDPYYEKAMVKRNGPAPYLFEKGKEPEWLNRVIAKLAKQREQRAIDIALFHDGRRKPTYLAVVWKNRNFWWSEFALYKVTVVTPQRVQLKTLRATDSMWDDEGPLFSFDPASGFDLTGEGVPVLVFSTDNGGLWSMGSRRIYKLIGETIDITPKEYRGKYDRDKYDVALLGDGSGAKIVTYDERWLYAFPRCDQCGPKIHIVSRFEKGKLVPDCTAHPGHYDSQIEWRQSYYDDFARRIETGQTRFYKQLQNAINRPLMASLLQAQSGRIAQGRKTFTEAWTDIKGKSAEAWNISQEDFDRWIAVIETKVIPIFEAVDASAACPISSYQPEPSFFEWFPKEEKEATPQ